MKFRIFCLGMVLGTLAACNAAEGDSAVAGDAEEQASVEAEAMAAEDPAFAVNSQGIMPDGTPDSLIAFGANSLDTVEAVSAVAGDLYDQDESDECGAGPMEFAHWGPIMLTFQNGEFVGWELRDGAQDAGMGLTNGATIGSTRQELEAAIGAPVTVEESTLGNEFVSGGISGLLDADTPDARVTALWAGIDCAMR